MAMRSNLARRNSLGRQYGRLDSRLREEHEEHGMYAKD